MKNLTTLLLLLALLPARAQPVVEQRIFTGKNGTVLPYRIVYPADYDRSRQYPLLLFLHGAGERGSDNEKQLTHGASLFLADSNRTRFPAIVVFPQCPAGGYWSSVQIDRSRQPITFTYAYRKAPMTAPLKTALELVDQLTRTERVDKNRLYIMGLSMGGMGTFEAVSRQPRRFAAAIPICGGGDTTFVRRYARRLPLWVFHGDADAVVAVDYSRQMVAALNREKANVTYTEYRGVNHNSWDRAFREPNLLPWLFAQHRRSKR